MKVHKFLAGVAVAASASLFLATPVFGAPPPDSPPSTGCPASFMVLQVDALLQAGYRAPAFVDENGDNLICARPLPLRIQEKFCAEIGGCQVPVVYNFLDNDLPARRG